MHLWDINRFDYPWLEVVPPIKRNYFIEDYQLQTAIYHIEKIVFVQCECLPEQCIKEREKADALARQFSIHQVFNSLQKMVTAAPSNVIYDIAVPASALQSVLETLPHNAVILMQKPMGENIQQANEIMKVCRRKNFTPAMNFQMRFIPASCQKHY